VNQIPTLERSTVSEYLVRRGVLAADSPVAVEMLLGGVSSSVFSVRQGDLSLVVKQALPKLRVNDDWFADPGRSLIESEALELASRVCPGSAPVVVDVDAEMFALVISHASADCVNWKDELLGGVTRADTGQRLGEFLAQWHCAEAFVPSTSRMRDQVNFIDLRVSPYYWEVAKHNSSLSRITAGAVRRMVDTRHSVVHGDFSPKNILVGNSGPFILDFEVAHIGDPAFDVAFLLHHLILKSVARQQSSDDFLRVAQRFQASYVEQGSASGFDDAQYLFTHIALLALARVDGKSRVEYLDSAQSDLVRAVAVAIALEPPPTLEEVWQLFERDL